MAEVLAVVGAIGAIANIIDATSKVISILSGIKARWKDADITMLSLASQLFAFRAALRKIQVWVDRERMQPHHQLIMDLDETLAFCEILIGRIEAIFEDWEQLLDKPAAAMTRWKVTFGEKGVDNVLVLVERQTSALTLLLTACNCETLAEQRQLLERPRSRTVLQRVKDDSASLLVHRDSASFTTQSSDNLSRLSLVFTFDQEIFSSGVYHRVFRGTLKKGLRRWQHAQQDWTSSVPVIDDTACIPTFDVASAIHTCYNSMLLDCLDITKCLKTVIPIFETGCRIAPKVRSGHSITLEGITHDVLALWQDPLVEALYDGPLPTSTIHAWSTGAMPMKLAPMTLCKFFGHQLKAIRDGRCELQILTCIERFSQVYETATPRRTTVSSDPFYDVCVAWSRTTESPPSDILNIIIDVPLTADHFKPWSRVQVVESIAIALNPLINDTKSSKPHKISFLLHLDDAKRPMWTLALECLPIANYTHDHYIDMVIAEIVRLFRRVNKDVECEYLTIWKGESLLEYMMLPVQNVATKGQVVVKDGMYHAKLHTVPGSSPHERDAVAAAVSDVLLPPVEESLGKHLP
ncbi:hypothetical protein BKA63DRAFT_604128 [Paraphoma chrysanthemicola]|nr:hypothetical protein BKA63DRAFT_604128 [Paraphoma chrysanthemicola]